jgi:glutaredoxin
MRLTLLTRIGCHLCEETARDLARLNVRFDTIDVDSSEELAARYGDFVPVLLADETAIAHAPIDIETLAPLLRSYSTP